MSRAEADASSTITKLLRTAVALSALLVGLWVTYYRLGTSFSRFGDEGYVLLSIKNYIAGDRLYTQLFSQYGPVFYFIQSGLFHTLHQPLTHDGGRRITLLLWIASALCGALVLYRLSRSVILASATWLAMMLIGASFVAEPNHPEHIILLLLILACCVALSPGAIWFGVLGGLGAALLLIKINIGLFFLVALFATLLCMLPTGLLRRVGAIAFTAYFLF